MSRRQARIIALKTLFELDISGGDEEEVLNRYINYRPTTTETADYAREVAFGVRKNLAKIDEILAEYATAFPLESLSAVDRNILRLALYEIFLAQVPVGVVINEAVELAKIFSSDSSRSFINGVLGSIVRKGVKNAHSL